MSEEDDKLDAAKGCILGVLIGAASWAAIIALLISRRT